MTIRYSGVLAVAVIAAAVTGCAGTNGNPTAESAAARSEVTTTIAPSKSPSATAPSTSAAMSPAPTGPPIGTATMRVSGAAQATIRYQINGGAEQIEPNVALPWEKQYPVYNEVQSSFTADAGDAELICSIIMDGKLLAFKTEPRPTCSFAYY